ncbi:MAG: hypothetical protein JSW27_02975 [Phycisphaerales bacterium]|nr:MAG: hypothetical protein JSW27_02975 [Phycisphaerales bacterium]
MELSWANKARIAAAATLGILVIGVLAWPLAVPDDPLAPVRSARIGFLGTLVLLALAFVTGLAGYFLTWPHGREIAILAVPCGLAVWVLRSGPMQALTQAYTAPAARQALLHSLRFEPVFWLTIVAAGFAGVLVAQHLRPGPGTLLTVSLLKSYLRPHVALTGVAALILGTLLAHFCLGVFAQDISAATTGAATQPSIGQVITAGIAAFAVAGFAIKKFFDLSYVWTAATSVLVIPFSYSYYGRSETVARFAETYPAVFFPHAVFAILPLQIVALGAIGSVLGYWLAVRYDFWRKHEAKA